MTNIEKKQILQAIDFYPLLTKNAKKVLKALVMFDQLVSAESVIAAASLSKQAVYPILKKLHSIDMISKVKNDGTYYLFEANKTKISEITELYIKTENIKKQNIV